MEEIRKKYDLLIHNSEVVLAQKRTFLDSCYQIACTQKLLAEVMILNADGFPASESQGKQEGMHFLNEALALSWAFVLFCTWIKGCALCIILTMAATIDLSKIRFRVRLFRVKMFFRKIFS